MRLLISIIDPGEAPFALDGGVDILDLKNPAEGSLGAPVPAVIRRVRQAAPRPQPLSVAIGDLPNKPGTAALAALGAAACGADYVKAGLWGVHADDEAIALARAMRHALIPYPGVSLILAAYADAGRAGTLDPWALPRIARAAGAAGCLIDTAIKDGRHVFDFLAPEALELLVKEAHAAGLLFALAGALRAEDLPVVRDLGADIAGVRSAACFDGYRNGTLDPERVRRLRAIVEARS